MATLELTKGQVTLVDDDDLPLLLQYRWQAKLRRNGMYYACTSIDGRTVYIMDVLLSVPHGMMADHINRDTLDNRRSNLRIVTPAKNAWNRNAMRGTASGYKGVSWNVDAKQWSARITVRGRREHLGYYDDASEAAYAYDNAARIYYGEFAVFNFPNEWS